LSPSCEEATLVAQLASWAESRHDTILYTKHTGTTFITSCEYPTGYVDPRIEFWTRFYDMINQLKTLIGELTFSSAPYPESDWWSVPITKYKETQLKFLSNFLSTLTTLRDIAQSELEEKALGEKEVKFLKETVSRRVTHGSGAGTYYNGWYFPLFYNTDPQEVIRADAVVTDIQTDAPSDEHKDPGCILHVATGNIPLSFIYVKSGKDEMVFSGPVYSFYEFDMPFGKRMTDEAWERNSFMPPGLGSTQSFPMKRAYSDEVDPEEGFGSIFD